MVEESKKQEVVAIFRYGIIAPALHMSKAEKKKYFKELAGKELDVPYYGMKKYGAGSFKDWLWRYRTGGIDNLKPRIRCDKGMPRKISDKILEGVKEIIKECPFLSISGIYRMLLKQGHARPGDFSETSLREWIVKYNLRETTEKKDRKKFEKENINELWITDFMHGPHIKEGKKKRKVYLCGIIDDHSRMIVGWGWSFQENSQALAMALKRAIAIYGVPNVLYCDNGKVFKTNYLQLACAKLGIALVHSQPYDSPSRGKIERWFKTVRDKFLAEINPSKLNYSEFINIFTNWIDISYHKHLHKGIGTRPIDKYFKSAAITKVKFLSDHEIDNAFLNEIERVVRKDATISIGGKLYEVPTEYIDKKIKLCFTIDQPDKLIITEEGKPVCQIKEVNLVENANKPYTGIHFKDIKEDNKND